jgi:hypothetical protein
MASDAIGYSMGLGKNPVKKRVSKVEARCIANLTYARYGINGLAKLYFYNENPLLNWSHNYLSFYLFRSKKDYDQILKDCKLL